MSALVRPRDLFGDMELLPVHGSRRRILEARVTLALISVMTAATIVLVALPDTALAQRFGLRASLKAAESWRLVTWLFPHQFGFRHLVLNGVALYLYGPYVERAVGGLRFALLFLLAGVFGGAWSVAAAPTEALTGSAGASLAVFGVFGALVGIGLAAAIGVRSIGPLGRPLVIVAALVLLVWGLTWTALATRGCGFGPGTAFWGVIAHSPGLVVGAVLGFAFAAGFAKRSFVPIAAAGAVLVASVVFVAAGWAPWQLLPSDDAAELSRCVAPARIGGA